MSDHVTTKQRRLVLPGASGRYSFYSPSTGLWTKRNRKVTRGSGSQYTVTEGHPFKGKYEGDLGGDFYTRKTECYISGHPSTLQWIDGKGRTNVLDSTFYCPGVPETASGELLEPTHIDKGPKSDVNALGATAIAQCAPTNPVAEAGLAAAELYRERLPSLPGIRLWKDRLRPLLGLSDDFLNAEFGWLPLVSDIKDTAKAISKHRQILEQYKRDDGKLVRRKFHYPSESTVTEETLLPNLARANEPTGEVTPSGVGPAVPAGSVVKRTETLRKTWFSGAFTYHIPDHSDSWSGMTRIASEAEQLFGINVLSPDTLWELTPWSWAIDWFTNTQDVLVNLGNAEVDGQVMRYGYMMDENISTTTYTMIGSSGWYNLPVGAVAPVTFKTVTKTRSGANPYGFGIGWEDLSPTQLAITAALGITRVLR